MPGSDDEFSDLEDIENDSDDDDTSSTPIVPPNQSSTSATLPSWSPTLTPVNVTPFTSHVGPKVAIPESPSDTFQLNQMFTPAFLDAIVKQTNLYAKEVMGEDKYESWEKVTQVELKAYLGFVSSVGSLPLMITEAKIKIFTTFQWQTGFREIGFGRSPGTSILPTTALLFQEGHLDMTGWERCVW